MFSTNWLHTFLFCNHSETCQGCKRRWNVCALWSDGSSSRRRRWEHPRPESHHSLRHPGHLDAPLLFRGWEALLLLPEMPKIRPIGLVRVSVQILSEYIYWHCKLAASAFISLIASDAGYSYSCCLAVVFSGVLLNRTKGSEFVWLEEYQPHDNFIIRRDLYTGPALKLWWQDHALNNNYICFP
jgi:hypothetical protein